MKTNTSSASAVSRRFIACLMPLIMIFLLFTANCLKPQDPTGGEEPQDGIYDVVIVGGGIAGLTAAYFLRGYSIKLLEKEPVVGGRTSTGYYEGLYYARGTEYLGKPEGALENIINQLNLQPVEIPEPMDARYYNGRFYYGEDQLESLMVNQSSQREYNKLVALMFQLSNSGQYDDVPNLDMNSEIAQLDNITARQWFLANGFNNFYQETYNVASRGLFGASLDEISALSLVPELAFEFVSEKAGTAAGSRPAESGSGAYTFVTGITEVTDALAQQLGNRVQLNAEVKSITETNFVYTITYEHPQEGTVSIDAHTIVLAVPAPVALEIGDSILKDEQKQIMQQIHYAPYITTTLFSNAPIFNSAFDLAAPDHYFFTDIYDSTWVQRAYDANAANINKHIIGLYISPQSYTDRGMLQLNDTQVLETIYLRLNSMFFPASSKVTGYDIQRFPYAYPVMTRGAYGRLTRLHEITTGGLQLAGDYMIYPTFEAAVESGYIAAQKIDLFMD